MQYTVTEVSAGVHAGTSLKDAVRQVLEELDRSRGALRRVVLTLGAEAHATLMAEMGPDEVRWDGPQRVHWWEGVMLQQSEDREGDVLVLAYLTAGFLGHEVRYLTPPDLSFRERETYEQLRRDGMGPEESLEAAKILERPVEG